MVIKLLNALKDKVNQTVKSIAIIVLCTVAMPVFAAGGLKAGTDAAETIKVWLYGFVGICAFIYLLYNVLMALAERKQWSDVGMALVYCSIAGGALVGGEWAMSIFK